MINFKIIIVVVGFKSCILGSFSKMSSRVGISWSLLNFKRGKQHVINSYFKTIGKLSISIFFDSSTSGEGMGKDI